MPPLRFRYQTIELGDLDVHVRTLRDRQQFSDDDGEADRRGISSANWPLFGVLWDASAVLAKAVAEYPFAGARVLEVGCGIALPSLVLRQLGADVTATDQHPEAEKFLAFNAALNAGGPVPFVLASWDEPGVVLGRFDLIIGSDLLYERGQPASLAAFINAHATERAVVLYADPGRGMAGAFGTELAMYGFAQDGELPVGDGSSVRVRRYRR